MFVPFNRLVQSSDSGIIPVALISLNDQERRRQLLQKRGIPFEWIHDYWPATDLRNKPIESLTTHVDLDAFRHFSGIRQQSSVIGCATSHKLAAHWLAKTDFHLMLVMEDDIMPRSMGFIDQIKSIAELLMPIAETGKAFICHLGPKRDQFEASLRRPLVFRSKVFDQNTIWLHIDPRPTLWRAHAYLISRGSALRSLETEPKIATVADDWVRRRELGLIDQIYMVNPSIIKQDESVPSTIGGNESIRCQLTNAKLSFLSRAKSSLSFRVRMQAAKALHMKAYSVASMK